MTKRIRVTFEMDLPNVTVNRSDLNSGILNVIKNAFPTMICLDTEEVQNPDTPEWMEEKRIEIIWEMERYLRDMGEENAALLLMYKAKGPQ